MADFKLVSNFKPAGDQAQAISSLVKGINNNEKYQTLLGITGLKAKEILPYTLILLLAGIIIFISGLLIF